jgi:hypothetical protein
MKSIVRILAINLVAGLAGALLAVVYLIGTGDLP